MKPSLLSQANSLFRQERFQLAAAKYQEIDISSLPESLKSSIEFSIRCCESELSKKSAATSESIGISSQGDGLDIHFLQILDSPLKMSELLDKVCFYLIPACTLIQSISFYLDANIDIQKLKDCDSQYFVRLTEVSNINFYRREEFSEQAVKPGESILYVYDTAVLSPQSKQFHSKIREFQQSSIAWRVHDDIQHHGSFYLKSIQKYFNPIAGLERLKSLTESLRNSSFSRHCIVAGTGPSLKYVYDTPEVEKSLIVTCNSAIYNETLMAFLKPHIICATDPIFHAGWGKYGEEFRDALIQRMNHYDFHLVVPTRDYHIYLTYLPEKFHDRVCCFNLDSKLEKFNLDLTELQSTKTTANVLTNIMLPLAASVAKEISIIGCDGKKNASGYFWEHDKSSQINQHMGEIQSQFKGFFDIDYDKYYREHCDSLKDLIVQIEDKGVCVRSSTPSYIPALVQRAKLQKSISRVSGHKVDISIVMPAKNASSTIKKSIDSVLAAASYAKLSFRLILINDGSHDNTNELIYTSFKDLIGSSILILDSPSLGVSAARNIGISFANSKYVTFLDADDLVSEDSFSSRVMALEAAKQKDSDVIGSFSKTHLVSFETGEKIRSINSFNEGRVYRFSDCHSPCHISSVLYHLSDVGATRFRFGMTNGEDWLFLAENLHQSQKLIYTDNSSTTYTMNSASATKKSPTLHLLKLFDILQILYLEMKLEGTISKNSNNSFLGKWSSLISRYIGACASEKSYHKGYLDFQDIKNINPKIFVQSLKLLEKECDKFMRISVQEFQRFNSVEGRNAKQEILTTLSNLKLYSLLDSIN